jgi:hypothetical protein
MKKLWIISAATCILAASASAQETDLSLRAYAIGKNHNESSGRSGNEVKKADLSETELKQFSNQTRANFYSDFGYIPITGWEISEGYTKISFVDKGVLYTAYYDRDDQLVGTISNITVADLPAHALENIDKMYNGYTIGEAVFFDDNELNQSNMMYYGRNFEDEDKYFVELQKAMKDSRRG